MHNNPQPCELSIVSRCYLKDFDCILQRMSEKMLSCSKSANITNLFINQMIPHHEAAIQMCENLLRYTTNVTLQNQALHIIKTQKLGIESMKEIENSSECLLSKPCDLEKYMETYKKIVKDMICKMGSSLRVNNININFISQMIPHHQGAILMSRNILRFSIDCRLEKIVKNIIEEQTKGIQILRRIGKTSCRA